MNFERDNMSIVMNTGDTKTYQCLRQWNEGDDNGLDTLLEQHLPWLQNQVRRSMGSQLRGKGETSDYVQDAVVEFLRYGPRFTLSSDAVFRALLLKIVKNTLRHRRVWFTARRRDIAREHPLPSDTVLSLDRPEGPAGTPSQSAARHEHEAWIRLGLELLDPEPREVLVLRKWDNLSFSEIGARLGISTEAARKRHNRALDRLSSMIWEIRQGKLNNILEESPSGRDNHDAGK
jgi:RNA polymerase sigma-70 factor (ECF subfamily)